MLFQLIIIKIKSAVNKGIQNNLKNIYGIFKRGTSQ